MVFSPTKMENVAQRGVLLKKQRWRGYSSPREDKEFFRKLTINTLTTGFLLVLPKFHSFDGRISPEETLVKRRMHKSEHLKENLIILFNINLLSIQNILLSAVPVSPFSHPKHGKKASPIRLQIKFDWFLGLLKIAHLNSLSTQFIPKPKLEFVFRVQPAHRQSVMVHVSVSVACTAQFN